MNLFKCLHFNQKSRYDFCNGRCLYLQPHGICQSSFLLLFFSLQMGFYGFLLFVFSICTSHRSDNSIFLLLQPLAENLMKMSLLKCHFIPHALKVPTEKHVYCKDPNIDAKCVWCLLGRSNRECVQKKKQNNTINFLLLFFYF